MPLYMHRQMEGLEAVRLKQILATALMRPVVPGQMTEAFPLHGTLAAVVPMGIPAARSLMTFLRPVVAAGCKPCLREVVRVEDTGDFIVVYRTGIA